MALQTQHGKELVISPVLFAALGYEVQRVDEADTDALGSFTLKIPPCRQPNEGGAQKGPYRHETPGSAAGPGQRGRTAHPQGHCQLARTELKEAFAHARAQSAQGQVMLENDLRAHTHPTRQDNIRRAAQDLAARLQSLCASCITPGFWAVDRIAGLPRGTCGVPTRETRAEVLAGLKCDYREDRSPRWPRCR